MIMALLAIILTLILVVGIHEAGHAVVARVFGVKIKKISIGFGRPLMQWQSNSGCEWVWAMWPLGGYVQLANSRISPESPGQLIHCFDYKPIWVRILILLAGAFANLLTAWLAFVLVFYIGLNYRLPQIQNVMPATVAARAGLASGDQFIAVAGRSTPSWQEVGKELVIMWGQPAIPVTVSRSNQLHDVIVDLSAIQFGGSDRSLLAGIGITPNLSAGFGLMQASSTFDAVRMTNQAILHLLYFFIMILKQLFSGVIPFSILLGPLGVFAASVSSLTQGLVVFLFFIASLSLAVALVNLFPVPGLDGGSIVYALLEKARGRPVSVAMEVLIHRLMIILFCVLLVHLLLNDLTRFTQ